MKIFQKCISENYEKTIPKKVSFFFAKMTSKMEPTCLPKSSQNRSWDHLGPRYVPNMVKESLQAPMFMFFYRFWLHFWWFWDKCLIDFRSFLDCFYQERRNDRTKHRLCWADGIPLADYNFIVLWASF